MSLWAATEWTTETMGHYTALPCRPSSGIIRIMSLFTPAISPISTNPYLLLTLTALFWSGNMVVGRGIRADVPPLTLAFWRWAIALALVLPLALPHLKAQWPLLKRGWKAGAHPRPARRRRLQHLRLLALQHTTATNAVLLNSFIPVVTIAISWVFLGKHLTRPKAIGVSSR
jgi:drug/metabolite transporter (DMT)-like permease